MREERGESAGEEDKEEGEEWRARIENAQRRREIKQNKLAKWTFSGSKGEETARGEWNKKTEMFGEKEVRMVAKAVCMLNYLTS